MFKRIFLTILFTGLYAFATFAQEDYYAYTTDNFRKQKIFQDTIKLENPDQKRLNAVLFYLTNEERKKRKLSELQYHPKLEQAASIHSTSMVENNFFSHINPRSKKLHDPNSRARFVGIENPFLAENIIETFVLEYQAGDNVYPGEKGVFRYHPEEEPIKPRTYLRLGEVMLQAWMDSPDHRENILSKKAVQLGCGTAFYKMNDFNGMPAMAATQNFQLHVPLRVME